MLWVGVPIVYAMDAANVAQAGKMFRVEQIFVILKGEVYILRLYTTLPRYFFMSNGLVLEQEQRFRCCGLFETDW